jgi:hypothetical protein
MSDSPRPSELEAFIDPLIAPLLSEELRRLPAALESFIAARIKAAKARAKDGAQFDGSAEPAVIELRKARTRLATLLPLPLPEPLIYQQSGENTCAVVMDLWGMRDYLVTKVAAVQVAAGQPREGDGTIAIIEGGFEYRGRVRTIRKDLSGYPLKILSEFVRSRNHRKSASDLLKLWGNKATCPTDQDVKVAVSAVRNALRDAIANSGDECPPDPIPFVDRGSNLAWEIKLPNF